MENKKQIIEEALINGKNLDELIKIKMKEEMQLSFSKMLKKVEKERIYDIKKISQKILFSKNAVFKKFNKINNTISYINGIQAEALLGLDEVSRNKLISGEIEVFSTDNSFVKFEYVEIICDK